MCCSHDQGKGVPHHGGCGCGSGGHFPRRFLSKEERVAKLEAYLKDLKAELKEVEGRIQAIKEGI